ncbi:MAG TPA: MgtC/SapB family protein [Firmicutes bacterium]|nr:MgtC/SapB family protein [Bacillota bacterium]
MTITIAILVRLAVATFLGAIIGLEREKHGRPAGLRTHILVALGSCLIMLISIYGFPGGVDRDPARLAAQVVSGIGFLGAGTILRDGTSIRGLTTAASLWVVAGIGLAAGAGFYWAAAITAVIAVLVLVFLDDLERKFIGGSVMRLRAELADRPGALAAFSQVFADQGISIKKIYLEIDEEKQKAVISLQIRGDNINKEKVLDELRLLPGLFSVEWN